MARTVSAKLQADVSEYVRNMRQGGLATVEVKDKIGDLGKKSLETKFELDALGRAEKESADKAKAAARDVEKYRDGLSRLDKQIAETALGLNGLAREFAHTGDPEILAKIGKERSALAELGNVRKLLPNPDTNATQSFGRKMVQGIMAGGESVSTLLGNHLGLTIGGAIGIAAVPVIVPALTSAISAGVSGGVLAAGLALAAKDPVVAARGEALGKSFITGLQSEAANAFQGPLLVSLDRLDAAAERISGKIGTAFDSLAPHIAPLTSDVIRAGEGIVDSLTRAAENSGPALDALGSSIDLLAAGASKFIDAMASGGPQAAANLELVAGATADVLVQTGDFLSVIDKLSTNPWLTGPLIPLLRKHYSDTADSAKGLGNGTTWVANGLNTLGTAAGNATGPVKSLDEQLADAAGHTRDLFGATTDVASAIANATSTIRGNAGAFKLSTSAGRANRDALSNVADAMIRQHDAAVAANGEGLKSAAVAHANSAAFIRLATEATGSADAARRLARQLGLLPSAHETKITVDTAQAEASTRQLRAELEALHGKTLTVRIMKVESQLDRFEGRVSGGPVRAGQAYIVGEKRPEVFVPSLDGRIVASLSEYQQGLQQPQRHVAMAGGGVINEPVFGYGASGTSYSLGEGGRPETVIPGVLPGVWQQPSSGGSAGGGSVTHVTVGAPVINVNGSSQSPEQIATAVSRQLGRQIDLALRSS